MRLEKYSHKPVEEKWQKRWSDDELYRSTIDPNQPKHYALTMLPYPSGDLHIGHWYAITPSDARARYMRMRGYNVLFPMGFDAFGLPAENAAIKRGIHPADWTLKNVERMREQLKSMGASFDWEREVVTCLPEYYKWTQWFFLKFFEKGIAYKKFSPVDFCPSCNTTLAREQVWGEDRHCERCDTPVVKKELNQWFFKITDYAEELLDFTGIDWPERVVTMQQNWIGRSEGAEVVFKTESGQELTIFTTRPDTLWGVTFMVLAPEHPLVDELTKAEQCQAMEAYRIQAGRQTEIERMATDKEKTGVFTGSYAINPVNGERVPIWVADYVMMGYGTGAIMAVPAHDQRDFDFAKKFGLEIKVVIQPDGEESIDANMIQAAVPAHGTMVHSGALSGTPGDESLHKAIGYVEELGVGKAAVNYRLRDWLISRQRYWGAPIPTIDCPSCGTVPVPYDELPVMLPEDAEFLPTGESPLKYHEGFKKTTCPYCGGPAERETDTMDTFMCSSWYQYGYVSPYHQGETPLDEKEAAYWLPVDQYTGGVEHACMHLIYTRFFTKVMRDLGLVSFDEPMVSLRNQGIILGEDSEKMSKSRGNVIAPDNLVQDFGADAVRAYLMFGWRWEQGGPWDGRGVEGVYRFLHRVWELILGEVPASAIDSGIERSLLRKVHQTIGKATQDMDNFSFNTYIAAMMELSNTMAKAKPSVYGGTAWKEAQEVFTLLLAPACPHITEEIWERLGHDSSIHNAPWPKVNAELAAEDMVELGIQINGKVKDRIALPKDTPEEGVKEAVLGRSLVQEALAGKEMVKFIVVPGRIVNIVVR